MTEEVSQKLELGRGQVQGAVRAPGGAAGRLEPDVAEAQVVGRRGPAQQGAHPRQHLFIREWLDEVVVGARVESADSLFGAAEGGEQQDRQRSGGTQSLADGDAVQAGQHDVEDDQVERWLAGAT